MVLHINEEFVMNKLKVAIADDNEITLRMLVEIVNSDNELEVVGRALDGKRLITLIKEKQPDVVLLDLLMPELDGIAVMEYVNADATIKNPAFIVVSSFDHKNLTSDAFALGAEYYMLKPFDKETVLNRIKKVYIKHLDEVGLNDNLTEANLGSGIDNEEIAIETIGSCLDKKLETDVTYMLRKIGIPANLKGYQYIRTAIIMAVKDMEVLDGITKILYPDIAKKYNSTTSRVERSVRHAIEVAWDRGSDELIEELFGKGISFAKGKPSNSEFIALLADKIRLKYNLGC